MAKYGTKLTTVGIAKLANAQVSSSKVQITHIAVGDGNGVAYTPTGAETALKREQWRGTVNKAELGEGNTIIVEGIVPATVGGFTMREVGLYDADGAMIAIGNYPDTEKTTVASGVAGELILRTIIKVANTSTVDLTINADVVTATKSDIDGISAQLAQSDEKIDNTKELIGVDPADFGAKGDGVTDDTIALQNAINFAQVNKLPLIDRGGLIYNISSPLYVTNNLVADFKFSTIRKTNNSLGQGSYHSPGRGVTWTYEVDAVIIMVTSDGNPCNNNHIKNLHLGNMSTSSPSEYGIYAPGLSKSSMKHIHAIPRTVKKFIFGYVWWLITEFDNIRSDGCELTFQIASDGAPISGGGGSTSIRMSNIIATDQSKCMRLFGVSYSTIDIPLIDHVLKNDAGDYAFFFSMCSGIVVNSLSTEYLYSGRLIYAEGSELIFNTPRAYHLYGGEGRIDTLINVTLQSKINVNNAIFGAYEAPGEYANKVILAANDGSGVSLNNCKLPTNGNPFRGLSNNSFVTEINSRGVTHQENGKTGIKTNNRFIAHRDSIPTTGTWLHGDIVLNQYPSASGNLGWICTVAGTPGTWKSFGSIQA